MKQATVNPKSLH